MVGTQHKNEAAFRELKRVMQNIPNACATAVLEPALKEGADYVRTILRGVIPISERVRSAGGQHLRNTVRVIKGRLEWFPSWIVNVGSTRARHYHLLEYGFRTKSGGRKEPSYIIRDAINDSLTETDKIIAAGVSRRNEELVREANNPRAETRNLLRV